MKNLKAVKLLINWSSYTSIIQAEKLKANFENKGFFIHSHGPNFLILKTVKK